jgi:membrane protein implicated in regulation of membrane protease activity
MIILDPTEEIFSQSVSGIIDQCEENWLRVKALGSIWNATLQAQCDDIRFACGQPVRVVGRKGIRLIIAP